MVQVKVCGIKKEEDASWAVNLGADILGFIFKSDNPRYISVALAKKIIKTLPPFVFACGVFFDEDPAIIKKIVKSCGLKMVQLNGNETPDYCLNLKTLLAPLGDIKLMKYFKLQNESLLQMPAYRTEGSMAVDYFLVDAFNEGVPQGENAFMWDLASKVKEYAPVFLFGGLTGDNVIKAIQYVRPYAVNVCETIESDDMAIGRKDYEKMKVFIKKAKSIF